MTISPTSTMRPSLIALTTLSSTGLLVPRKVSVPLAECVAVAESAAAAGEHGVVAQALLLGGQPLGEPVVRYGPFVMNTRDEIVQAFRDYEEGTLVRGR